MQQILISHMLHLVQTFLLYGRVANFLCTVNFTTHLTTNLLIIKLFSIYSVRSVMHKYLEKESEISFDKIFNQILGKSAIYLLFNQKNYHKVFLGKKTLF